MKQELTLEASVGPDASVLVAVAATLQSPRRIPSAFVWSIVPDTAEARIWITFDEEIPDFLTLVTELRRISGVRRILMVGPMHNLILES